MYQKIITMLMLSFLPLMAQEDFLAGVRAQDLILDKIESVTSEDTVGISDWSKFFFNAGNEQLNSANKMKIVIQDDGIWVINLDNMEKNHLSARGFMPQWSPKDDFIAYLLQRPLSGQYYKGHQLYGGAEIWICEPTGEHKQNLTPSIDIGEFQWSSDGKLIAFTYRDEDQGKWALGILNIESQERKFLDVFSPYDYAGFSFSPNSQLVAYCKPMKWKLEGDWINIEAEIYIINIDGTGRTKITNTAAIEKMVKWSRDESKLIVRQSPDPEYVKIILKKRK